MKNTYITENQIFGKLKAIKLLNKSSNKRKEIWLFLCECGNEYKNSTHNILKKNRKMCDICGKKYRKEFGLRLSILRTKPDKDGPITKLFGDYRRSSKRRGYEWNINKNFFKKLIYQNCFYCGRPPSSQFCIARIKKPENILIYNGIDRKNNELNYTEENCITACSICNRMKMDLKYEEFISKIKEIYELHHKENDGTPLCVPSN